MNFTIFRVISPYKGELEMWYQSKRSFFLRFTIIFLTAYFILYPDTRLYERWFKELPLRNFLNFIKNTKIKLERR